ncbi:MAG: hypothetical protein ACTSQ8_24215 [Candidatus Helarchaeota archaeon]
MNPDIITKIDPNKLYNMGDLVKLGAVLNAFGNPATRQAVLNAFGNPATRQHISTIICKGKLKARDLSMSPIHHYWAVRGSDLIKFIKENYL